MRVSHRAALTTASCYAAQRVNSGYTCGLLSWRSCAMCSRILVALIGLLVTSLANAQVFVEPTAPGRITGSVLSEDGQSIDRARVCVTIKRVSATGNSALGD